MILYYFNLVPTVHVDPGPHRVEYGHDITLVCNLTYSPFFYNASWKQVQTGLITEYRTNVSQILFKISDATFEDSGQYTCNAASQYGSRQSQPVNIRVYGGMIFQRILLFFLFINFNSSFCFLQPANIFTIFLILASNNHNIPSELDSK